MRYDYPGQQLTKPLHRGTGADESVSFRVGNDSVEKELAGTLNDLEAIFLRENKSLFVLLHSGVTTHFCSPFTNAPLKGILQSHTFL